MDGYCFPHCMFLVKCVFPTCLFSDFPMCATKPVIIIVVSVITGLPLFGMVTCLMNVQNWMQMNRMLLNLPC